MKCRPIPYAIVAQFCDGPLGGELLAVPYPGRAYRVLRYSGASIRPENVGGRVDLLEGEYRRASPIRKNGRASFVFSGWRK